MNNLQPAIGARTALGSYGIHETDDGVAHLFQDVSPRGWNFFGIEDPSNMSVKHLRNGCSHAINPMMTKRSVAMKHWEIFAPVAEDPLVQAMLPVPNGKTYYLPSPSLPNHVEWLSCLERMNSPLHTWVRPFWSVPLKKICSQLSLTNIHPIVLTGLKMGDIELATRLVEAARQYDRTLILCLDDNLVLPTSVEKIDTKIHLNTDLSSLIKLPLEHIGASIVSRHCRGEELFNPNNP